VGGKGFVEVEPQAGGIRSTAMPDKIRDQSPLLSFRKGVHDVWPQPQGKSESDVSFIDDKKFKEVKMPGIVLTDWPLYTDILDADKVINVPVDGLVFSQVAVYSLLEPVHCGADVGIKASGEENLAEPANFYVLS
jgi:hypothetical protein